MKELVFDGEKIVQVKARGIKFDNRGVLFGETIFTTLRTYEGKPLFLSDHLQRLERGLSYFFDDTNYNWLELEKLILQGIKQLQEELVTSYYDIYLRITLYPENLDSTGLGERPDRIGFFILGRQIKYGVASFKEANVLLAGKKLYDRYLPSYVKVGTYIETARELRLAKDKNFNDVLFLNKDEVLAEGATSNLFFRKKNMIYTPDIKTGILEGITRDHLINCLKKSNLKIVEGFYPLDCLMTADEAWLSSSVKGIRPIKKLEDKIYLDSKSNESWTTRLITQFDNYCKAYEK